MKKILIMRLAACLFAFICLNFGFAKEKKVFVFEIKSEIDPRTSRYTKLALDAATEAKADILVLELNTFGGTVDDADKIRTLLLDYPRPIFVFINKNAASAGALISIACDSIYMANGSSIGAATVVSGNDGMPVPEKYQSYMRSLMRSTAESNKRDATIAEAFVDPDIQLDSTIKKNGKVLTFTTIEALKYGFCEAKLNSIEEILERNMLNSAEIIRYKTSTSENIISFFINPAISGILILIIIGGIYFELQTPGIGFPLFAAILAAILYFVPYYLNGLAEYWEIGVFFVGFILLGLEIFVIPGFGVVGIAGIVCLFGSLILIMLNNKSLDFDYVSNRQLFNALWPVLVGFISSFVLIIVGSKALMQSKYFKKISLTGTDIKPMTIVAGVDNSLVGQMGITKTVLKPFGKIAIDGVVYEASSDSSFIDAGVEIKVTALVNG
ncbi:MAG: NfeD family protein, partial [Cytophagales bacterium]